MAMRQATGGGCVAHRIVDVVVSGFRSNASQDLLGAGEEDGLHGGKGAATLLEFAAVGVRQVLNQPQQGLVGSFAIGACLDLGEVAAQTKDLVVRVLYLSVGFREFSTKARDLVNRLAEPAPTEIVLVSNRRPKTLDDVRILVVGCRRVDQNALLAASITVDKPATYSRKLTSTPAHAWARIMRSMVSSATRRS